MVCFLDRRRHRFFNENINPRIDEAAADACVFLRRHGEADGLHASGGERIDIGNDARAEFRGDLPGALGISVDDAGEFHAFELAPHADMIASELTGTDDYNANGFLAHDFGLV